MTSATLDTHRIVRRFAGNDWNWNAQAANAAPQTAAPWAQQKGDPDGARWSPDDTQQKELDDDIVWNTRPQGNDKGGSHPPIPEGEMGVGDLEVLLRGVPGTDFPDFTTVPDTAFDCAQHPPSQGYYADMEAGCQVFHICQPSPVPRRDSFLCPLGTIFNQRHLVCDWWFNVNCSESEALYSRNLEIYADQVVKTTTTTSTTTTTEKPQMPWSAQDLDKKRPPSGVKGGWPMGKQHPAAPRKDVAPNKRGGKKSDSPVGGGAVSGAWSQVQKEVTLSWTTSGGGGFGSPSSKATSWNNGQQHSTKPVWFGIDGHPSKDQSDPMRKRTGLLPPSTSSSFGTRLKSSSSPEGTSSAFQPTTSPRRAHSANWMSTLIPDSTARRHSDPPSARFTDIPPNHSDRFTVSIGEKFPDTPGVLTGRFPATNTIPDTTTGGRFPASNNNIPPGKFPDTTTGGGRFPAQNGNRFPDPSINSIPTSSGKLPDGGKFPATSIVPSGVSGVWEQDTTRVHKGVVTKSESFVHQRGTWGERSQVGDPISASGSSARRAWRKLKKGSRMSARKKALHPKSVLRQKERL